VHSATRLEIFSDNPKIILLGDIYRKNAGDAPTHTANLYGRMAAAARPSS
jgi:hypothetical protein